MKVSVWAEKSLVEGWRKATLDFVRDEYAKCYRKALGISIEHHEAFRDVLINVVADQNGVLPVGELKRRYV